MKSLPAIAAGNDKRLTMMSGDIVCQDETITREVFCALQVTFLFFFKKITCERHLSRSSGLGKLF